MENPDESASESIPQTSIMDSLGVEIVGVVAPVSVTMLLVVFLLTSLYSSTTSTDSPPVSAATLIYTESPSDSTSQKFIGSLEDAVAFIVLIAIATFILVLLYYYNFTKFLKNYMRFSVFFTLATIGGSILASLLQRFSIPLDAITATILLLNFAILGVLSVFSTGMPILIKQSYMVAVSVIIAVWFARLPEWTTWTLLIALAIYDLVAVLSPHGPLRILVELAQSRDDELPALVYEARPNINPQIAITRPIASLGSVELQPVTQSSNSTAIDEDEERSSLVLSSHIPNSSNPNPQINQFELIRESSNPTHSLTETETTESETSPLVSRERQRPPLPPPNLSQENQTENDFDFEFEMFDSTRGIRLGLGDFIFYSVLVGRAAMFDLMTVYACYLAIIAGLGCTLILLSVFRKALPALPISIFLGVVFYFLTRILMEPFVVGASTNLVMF